MKRVLLTFVAILACFTVPAQTVHPPVNAPVFRALDPNGAPLAGGKLYSYVAGSSTPLATYADALAASPNANPVILDSTGSAKIFLGSALYKLVLQDANGVPQWTVDDINGAPASSGVSSVFGRSGDVVAVTGDYTCAQVTGAVCSLPTLHYQTVNAGGTALPQEATLKFLAPFMAVDNSAGGSTDVSLPADNVTYAIVTGSRAFGTVYHNASGHVIDVGITVQDAAGSGTGGSAIAMVGSSATPTDQVATCSATQPSSTPVSSFMSFVVPVDGYYEVTRDVTITITKWTEYTHTN